MFEGNRADPGAVASQVEKLGGSVHADQPPAAPEASALQRCIRAVRADYLGADQPALLRTARDDEIETGSKLRIDSTVTETHILEA